jgi:hypothetical protein
VIDPVFENIPQVGSKVWPFFSSLSFLFWDLSDLGLAAFYR